ncbi:hypothetical protein AAHC03_04476 [Spirometra sp. Aus1]
MILSSSAIELYDNSFQPEISHAQQSFQNDFSDEMSVGDLALSVDSISPLLESGRLVEPSDVAEGFPFSRGTGRHFLLCQSHYQ